MRDSRNHAASQRSRVAARRLAWEIFRGPAGNRRPRLLGIDPELMTANQEVEPM